MATKNRPAPPLRITVTTLVPGDAAPGRADYSIGEFIVDQVRAGVDVVNACGAVGVMPAELQSWMREGTMVRARLNAGARWDGDFTTEQQDLCLFADLVVRASSAHISRLAMISEEMARGILPAKVRTVRKTLAGNVVEETVTTEKMLPDGDMLRWKLERLAPTVYGQKATLNVTVTDLTDTDAVGEVVAARMLMVAKALAIESASHEVEPLAVSGMVPDEPPAAE